MSGVLVFTVLRRVPSAAERTRRPPQPRKEAVRLCHQVGRDGDNNCAVTTAVVRIVGKNNARLQTGRPVDVLHRRCQPGRIRLALQQVHETHLDRIDDKEDLKILIRAATAKATHKAGLS